MVLQPIRTSLSQSNRTQVDVFERFLLDGVLADVTIADGSEAIVIRLVDQRRDPLARLVVQRDAESSDGGQWVYYSSVFRSTPLSVISGRRIRGIGFFRDRQLGPRASLGVPGLVLDDGSILCGYGQCGGGVLRLSTDSRSHLLGPMVR